MILAYWKKSIIKQILNSNRFIEFNINLFAYTLGFKMQLI